MRIRRRSLLHLLIMLLAVRAAAVSEPVRIGYFYGGRTNMIYRTSIFGFFEEEGVEVDLYTPRFLRSPEDQLNTTMDKGLMQRVIFQGMSIPVYTDRPLLEPEVLTEMDRLLLEYGFIKSRTALEAAIDNSFLEEVLK